MGRLERYTVRGGSRLRKGYTTGACAAAAAKAAAVMLLDKELVSVVDLRLPSGILLELDVERVSRDQDAVTCGVRKDAGDDPDVTDGMLILATVSRCPSGIHVEGGQGVGRVTRRGLPRDVGEAAINPAPLEMIRGALAEAGFGRGYSGGFRAIIWAPQGEEIARRTFNSRLGILGGISILGTTGIVEPMSEAALVATIRAEIDVRREAGESVLLLTPGNYGREFARERFGVDLDEGIKCSNFVGEAIDYAVYRGFTKLALMGHGGKLVKLAGGIMNTHSAVADGRMEIIACHCALQGLDTGRVRRVFECATVDEADELLAGWRVGELVWKSIGERIRFQLEHRIAGRAEAVFGVFCRSGIVLQSEGLEDILMELRQRN